MTSRNRPKAEQLLSEAFDWFLFPDGYFPSVEDSLQKSETQRKAFRLLTLSLASFLKSTAFLDKVAERPFHALMSAFKQHWRFGSWQQNQRVVAGFASISSWLEGEAIPALVFKPLDLEIGTTTKLHIVRSKLRAFCGLTVEHSERLVMLQRTAEFSQTSRQPMPFNGPTYQVPSNRPAKVTDPEQVPDSIFRYNVTLLWRGRERF